MIRRLAVALAIFGLLGASAVQAHDAERQAQLIDELLRLTSEDVPQRIIIKQIRAWCFRFELDGDDIVELHTLGVSDDIIEALIDTAFDELECEETEAEIIWYRGVYSPWWCVPYAWGWYWWDPWPVHYVGHHFYYPYWYYPYHYYEPGYHHGYYGWHGSDYYVAYNPRTRPRPEPRATDGYRVVGAAPAVPVSNGTGVNARRPEGPSVVTAPGSTAGDQIATRRSPTVVPRTGSAASQASPPRARSTQPRLTPAVDVGAPSATPARQATPPRTSPRSNTRSGAAEPRLAVPSPRARTQTPSARAGAEARLKSPRSARITPSTPAKRNETGVKSGAPRRAPAAQPRVQRGSRTKTAKYATPPQPSGSKSVRTVKPSKRSSSSRSSKYSRPPAPSSKKSEYSKPSRSTKSSVSRSSPSRSASSVSRPSRAGGSRMSRPSRSSGSRASASRGRSSGRSSPPGRR